MFKIKLNEEEVENLEKVDIKKLLHDKTLENTEFKYDQANNKIISFKRKLGYDSSVKRHGKTEKIIGEFETPCYRGEIFERDSNDTIEDKSLLFICLKTLISK